MLTTIKPDFMDRLELLFARVEKWFRGFEHRRYIEKIRTGLMKNPALMVKTKDSFEKAFGVNSHTRSPKQWGNLVRVYGIQTVMTTEKMTEEEVREKCSQSFKSKVSRVLK
jgi:hypothetical protein